jgi:hypothetical protein
MYSLKLLSTLASLLVFFQVSAFAAEPQSELTKPYSRWSHGPPNDFEFFPIAVWLQDPKNAERYKEAGINTYVGLWRGPAEAQLAALQKAGMRVICSQNELSLANKDNPIIVGWMHGDEPDNAQSLGRGQGYGPPILPATIFQRYEKMRAADPTRPILLNLGQGVAWDNYIGRGVRRNHPEDYPEYLKGCDIASFDIYPAVHSDKAIAGKLEFVPRGVERLIQWTGGKKVVWNCIECTRISNVETKPTPAQVRTEVWMSLIYGSRGLIYFVHQFQPVFREAALLDDAEMLAAVKTLNRQIQTLAPVLAMPTITNAVAIISSDNDVPIASMLKRNNDVAYLFAVAMQPKPTKASFTFRDLPELATVEVLNEGRTISVRDRSFSDEFGPYEVHLYRISAAR